MQQSTLQADSTDTVVLSAMYKEVGNRPRVLGEWRGVAARLAHSGLSGKDIARSRRSLAVKRHVLWGPDARAEARERPKGAALDYCVTLEGEKALRAAA
jgi:hypothetical protein